MLTNASLLRPNFPGVNAIQFFEYQYFGSSSFLFWRAAV